MHLQKKYSAENDTLDSVFVLVHGDMFFLTFAISFPDYIYFKITNLLLLAVVL